MSRNASPSDADPSRLIFFLGGHDLEMLVIGRMVCRALGPAHVVDKGLRWGAKASDYAPEVGLAVAAGQTPVLVELGLDAPGLTRDAIIVDHHGERATGSTSLEQAHALLGRAAPRWTRWHNLVAQNDRGHVRAMRAYGARTSEMRRVRRADRMAQGITQAEEEAAGPALTAAEQILGGRGLLVRLPHGRAAVVADRLALAETDAPPNLVIVSPEEINVYGEGRVIRALAADRDLAGGWWGGDLPDAGFWGIGRGGEALPRVLAALGAALSR